MKKFYLLSLAFISVAFSASAQFAFDVSIDTSWVPTTVVVPKSPLKTQVLFIGGVDSVQTTATYGNAASTVVAKEWHDFIGFTPDNDSDDLGWISVNHEMIQANPNIGDGGGMTVFKVKRDATTDTLIVVEQTLADSRSGKFFNVDFVNTVGETGMNCGGINSADGRIWTAEEWFRTSNASIASSRGAVGVNDTSDYTISSDIAGFDGKVVKKYQNFNWMVEIDPKEAKAIRKQYNWGRQPFEGGAIMADNKTVYLSPDNTPAVLTKFVAETAGDFTTGKLYAYKHDGNPKWIELNNASLDTMLNVTAIALNQGATMYNRLEWAVESNGKVYFTETGRDGLGTRFSDWAEGGKYGAKGVLDEHWVSAVKMRHPEFTKSNAEMVQFVMNGEFHDYYGRVLEFDPAKDVMTTFLEGGPYLEGEATDLAKYPNIHLSNPDGLTFMTVEGRDFMVIQEDLNGTSYGRVPAGVSNRTCEMYLLDMLIENPTINDLVRIAIVPAGAEITGARATTDGKTLLVNSQHPSSSNPFPYNHSLTIAITGWDEAVTAIVGIQDAVVETETFTIYPNPVARELFLSEVSDIAIYDFTGKRLKVFRGVKSVDVSDLKAGTYFVRNQKGDTQKLIVK